MKIKMKNKIEEELSLPFVNLTLVAFKYQRQKSIELTRN